MKKQNFTPAGPHRITFPEFKCDFALHVLNFGKRKATATYYVRHNDVAVRVATPAEIEAWHAVLDAQMHFERVLKIAGNYSKFVPVDPEPNAIKDYDAFVAKHAKK